MKPIPAANLGPDFTEQMEQEMTTLDTMSGLELLRKPFAPNQINYLPKGGVKLAYVGHAALTDRLLDVDPMWAWEPMALTSDGLPFFDSLGGLWIRLTVLGVSRIGYGHAGIKEGGDSIKEVIGDALRNAAMRFGAALELWHKGDLHGDGEPAVETAAPAAEPNPFLGFTPQQSKTIRTVAQACIQAFNEGNEWSCYEEYTSFLDKASKTADMRVSLQLVFSNIFGPHSALRASIKKHEEAAREKARA